MASSAMLDIRLAGGAEASGPAPSHMGGCTDTRAWRIPMHTRRTRYLLQPGESPTLPERTVPQVLRIGLARDMLGLEDERIITSPAVSFPLPRYLDGAPLRGAPGARPEAPRPPVTWPPGPPRERLAGGTGGGAPTRRRADASAPGSPPARALTPGPCGSPSRCGGQACTTSPPAAGWTCWPCTTSTPMTPPPKSASAPGGPAAPTRISMPST